MKKERKTAQATAASVKAPKRPTWREERFIEYYLKSGNATHAAIDAGYTGPNVRSTAAEVLAKPYIAEIIDHEREKMVRALKFDRMDALKILVGMVSARASDFTAVLKDPSNPENYVGLGLKEYAIESTEKSYKNGNKVKLISNAERRAVINDLWEKLGLGKEGSAKDWTDGLDGLLGLIDDVSKQRPA